MQFNSFVFIMLFLPATVLTYFAANSLNYIFGKLILIVASIIFYTYSDAKLAAVLGLSLGINFGFAFLIQKIKKSRALFIAPLVINIGILIYFKYTNFFVDLIKQYAGIENIGGGERACPAFRNKLFYLSADRIYSSNSSKRVHKSFFN